MHIQLLSDLHCEHFNEASQHLAFPKISEKAEIIIMPGDIHSGVKALEVAEKISNTHNKHVIITPGNHEYYNEDIRSLLKMFREYKHPMVHVLLGVQYPDLKEEELFVDLNGVRFVGGTFWTDFNLYKGSVRMPTQSMAMKIGEQGINDFRLINNRSRKFTAVDSVEYFQQCYKLVNQILDKDFNGKKVLVSHHGLHKNSIHEKFRGTERELNSPTVLPNENTGWMINPAFASHCPELLEKVDFHFHGHTHSTIFYEVGKCKVYANPRGYPLNREGQLRFENSTFNPELLIDLDN